MRGIGAVAINFVKSIPEDLKKKHVFVLFLYDEGQAEALSVLDLNGLNYEIRALKHDTKVKLKLPGRLRIINGFINSARSILSIYTGDSRINDLSGLDSFLQFDQMRPLPRNREIRTGLILYDLIPYIMEADYLWSYSTARRHQNSRKAALRKSLLRKQYAFKTRAITKRADTLIAISNHTKHDFIKYLSVNASKIQVVHLGVEINHKKAALGRVKLKRYKPNSWGYFPEPIELLDKPFLLFVGGADPRRKLNDLVAAFNNLKAQGHDIRLVFAGDTMKGPGAIPVIEVQEYIAASSYLEDIVFLGFVTDAQKDWLYENTMGFVFPSVYEGFGLPVLEAMSYGCPVISYPNEATVEVAGNSIIYSRNVAELIDSVKGLLAAKNSDSFALKQAKARQRHAKSYTWGKTCTKIISLLAGVS
jgi:glycosyltransferase involved in cell wall biosynthesis